MRFGALQHDEQSHKQEIDALLKAADDRNELDDHQMLNTSSHSNVVQKTNHRDLD